MERPIIIFDNESTGADPVQDRIVQFAAIRCSRDLYDITETIDITLNPGIPISPSATAVHGFTDEAIAGQPRFGDVAQELYDFLYGCDYAGYNIKDFDVPMLSEEFARCGYSWPAPGSLFIDAFHIFRTKERRDLTAAYKFYCGLDLAGAHNAGFDILATRNVLLGQIARYTDLNSVELAAAFCSDPRALDLAGKIALNDEGVAVYTFGKDKGKSIKDNPGFGRWMLGQSFPTNTKNILKSLIDGNG